MTQAVQGYALAGLLAHAVLVVLYAAVWRAQRARWAACFGGVFAILTLIFLFDQQWRPVGNRAHPMPLTLGLIGAALIGLGIIDLVAPAPRVRRVLTRIAVALPALLWLAVQVGAPPTLLVRGLALMLASLAGLVLWAAWRQRDAGHLLVFLVFVMFPAVMAAGALGLVPTDMLRYVSSVPTLALGMTLLTQGLLRAQRLAHAELAGREAAERALQTLNESLEQRVQQRTAELHEVVNGLESFNRSVSHDLRGPLGGIAGVSRLAREALGRGETAQVDRMLTVIGSQAEASTQLVTALLSLARVGDATLAPQAVDLDAFVRDTLEHMRQADPGGHALPVKVQPLPQVHADPELLRQVVVNLVGNAIKFSLDATVPQIVVGALGPDPARADERVLYVKDNGVGFDMREAQQLFTPFERLRGAQRFQGHGVGLSIVKRIVERHGGKVWAESAPDRGSTFFFSLPA